MIEGITLALDGSTYSGSVAVLRGQTVLSERQLPQSAIPGRSGRDENFMPMVAGALDDASISVRDIDRVICGEGPGSFTSLRVAASIAKGISVGRGCPLFAASSLILMIADLDRGKYLATLPAMRGESFALLADVTAVGQIDSAKPIILSDSAIDSYLGEHGAARVVETPHARAVRSILPSVIAGGPRDIDSWEPAYGRLAEAQVKWEAAHGRPLPAG